MPVTVVVGAQWGDEGKAKIIDLLSKEHTEIELSSIRTVKIDQSLLDRMLDVGTLRIYTAGDTPELEMKGLPEPAKLREVLRP